MYSKLTQDTVELNRLINNFLFCAYVGKKFSKTKEKMLRNCNRRGKQDGPSLPELLKEPKVVDAGSAGEVDDPGEPVPLYVVQRHVPLVVRLIACVGDVLNGRGEMPEHDSGATQHLDRPCRRRFVLGSNDDPDQRRRDEPQRVREPRQRRLL